MDLLRTLSDLKEQWPWLSPFLAGATWLLGRRQGWRPWQSLVRQYNLNRELATCQQDRDNERRSKEFAMAALREMADAGSLVAKAAAEGRLTISEPSSSTPATSRRGSIKSRPTRKQGPLELP